MRPLGAVDDRFPAFLDVVVDLVDRLLAEVGDVSVDEVFPELCHLLGGHGFGQGDGMRFETVAFIDFDETRVRQEYHLVTHRGQSLSDTNRVERRSKGGFGEKGESLLFHVFSCWKGTVCGAVFYAGKMRVSRADQPSVILCPTWGESRSATSAVRREMTGVSARGVLTCKSRSSP